MNCKPCIEFAEFDQGDIVELITGGPDLAVLNVCSDCGDVDVAWFNGDSLEIATLPSAVLVAVTVH